MTEAARPCHDIISTSPGGSKSRMMKAKNSPDVAAAMVLALRMASELASDRDNYRGCFVRVTDDKGDELARIPVRTV